MPEKRPAVDQTKNEETFGRGVARPLSAYHCITASSSRMGPGPDSGSSAPSSILHSLATSHDEEDDDDEENSSHQFNDCGGSRSKSNQRWMKLRTTVQLSSAISTIQKKPPLKREDSFLKRFSTRQIPESQETIDTGEGEGDLSDDKNSSRKYRRHRRTQKPPQTVVNPDENFYYYWLMLLSTCVLYNLWTLIVRQSMPELQDMAPAIWLSCDGFTDLVFFLDVGVQFRTGYLEQGLMVYNSKKLAGHYFQSKSFVLDLLALIPLDLLQVNLGINPMLRFPRFLKVYRVYNYYYMVESRTVYPNLWRVLNLIHILLILAHWFGCFYYLLSEAEGFHGDWVYPYRPGEYATLTRKYLGSLYWSTLTLTTIGDLPTPETNAEAVAGGNSRNLARRGRLSRLLQFKHDEGYVFTIVSYLIGVFIFATIVGQVGNVITNRNANRLEFERLLDGAKTYMRHHKVPGGMKRRVLRWYDYSWSRGRIQGGGDINTALGLLPDKLKTELALHVNLSVLKKVTIFQECQPEFLHDLVLKMKAYIFTPGDSICRKGEVAREMFIIADGILEVISETGRVLTTMKAGDFFGEIGILNLDGLNKRTADVRSVGYSELFSLSREDVLSALKDYPEAQEILQKLGEKRLREAQHVARSIQNLPSSSHDSSDNSTSKRIVDKLKSDVKGLKNVLRKSRKNIRSDESLELQPLTSKLTQLRRQTRIEETQDICISSPEPPISPLGAGLPLLSRLKLLKEKQEREEKRNLMEIANQIPEQIHTTADVLSSHNTNNASVAVPLLHRLLHIKSKTDVDTILDHDTFVIKESQLPQSIIPEEHEIFISTQQNNSSISNDSNILMIQSPTSTCVDIENDISRKPWAMLKEASIKTTNKNIRKRNSQHTSFPSCIYPADKFQIRQNLVQLRQQTKMYASIDDLSPEYCGLPFVKKLKILNERQKLAELEKSLRSSSFDYSGSTELECDTNLTRSHSEACAIDYKRKLAKLNKGRICCTFGSSGQISPENETLERQNLKSILKKLSAGSRPESSETSTISTPDHKVIKAELKQLMRAPTLEGYVARHSKLSKSVTFNKYTLQSPPDTEQRNTTPVNTKIMTSSSSSSSLAERAITLVAKSHKQNLFLSQSNKLKFHPVDKQIIIPTQILPELKESEYIRELFSDIKAIIQSKLEGIQNNFQQKFTLLEYEIQRRDEIISTLKARILELEKTDSFNYEEEDSVGGSTELDTSLEGEIIFDNEDHPFMRDSSVDTVFTTQAQPHQSNPISITRSSTHNRLSWEQHSEEETLELQDLPRSITPESVWMGEVAIDVETSDESENTNIQRDLTVSNKTTKNIRQKDEISDGNNHNWEIIMLAEQLEKKRRSSECSSSGS